MYYGEHRKEMLAGLRFACALLRGAGQALPPEAPNPFGGPEVAVETAIDLLTSFMYVGRPVHQRFARPSEWRKHGATHVLYQRVKGMEQVSRRRKEHSAKQQ